MSLYNISAAAPYAGIDLDAGSGKVTATTFVGDLSGNAASSSTAIVTETNTGTLYPTFVNSTNSGTKPLLIDSLTTPISYSPATGALSTTTFVGDLSGNASKIAIGSASGGTSYSVVLADASGTTVPCYRTTTTTFTYSNAVGTLTVAFLNLWTFANTVTFSAGVMTMSGSPTFQDFKWTPTTTVGTVTGISYTNKRTGCYVRVIITNSTGTAFSINNSLTGNVKTNWTTPVSIASNAVWIMSIAVFDNSTSMHVSLQGPYA